MTDPVTLSPALEADLLAAVDAGFDAQIAFTQALVRIPSLRGNEAPVQDFLAQALRQRGYTVDRWRVREADLAGHPGASPVAVSYEQAWNVVGTHRPAVEQGRSLMLSGHIDVVPTGPADMWTDPPFSGVVRDGYLYGRGSNDMKAGVALNLFALDAVRAAGFEPASTVHVETLCEEECTGNGALSSLLRGYRADAWFCPEPSGGELVDGNVGVVWFKLVLRGKPAHTSAMQSGFNAIDSAWKLVAALRELEAEWNARKGEHPLFANHPHPLNLNVAQIRGGDWTSMVPAWCEVECRFAMYPGQSAAWVREEVERVVAETAAKDAALTRYPPKVEWHGFFCEGYVLPRGSDAETALAGAHEAVTGGRLGSHPLIAYLDARVPVLYGNMPALVYGPTGDGAHGIDERVEIESIRRVTKTLVLFIARWCGLARRAI